MLRLQTLGGLWVERAAVRAGDARLRPRALGVLALAAAGRTAGISRDKVLAFLWPESDEARSRHVLAQMLYLLRQRLGGIDVFEDATVLRLDPAVVTVDAWEFEDAIERDHVERAAALYGGAYLDGFYLSGARDFERWVDAERQRLAGMARRALEACALSAAARGDHATSADWWRRLAGLDPLNGRVAAAFMRALAAAGDRSAALRYARVHEELTRQELGEGVEPEVRRVIEELRRPEGSPEPLRHLPQAVELDPAAFRPVVPLSGAPAPVAAKERYERYVAATLAPRYRIVRPLGRQGLATSFEASDARSGAGVTLYVLLPALAAMVDAPRLIDALHRIARLAHPGIFPITAVGQDGDVIYLATPVITSETLAARLSREGQLPVEDAIRIGRDMAAALACGHAHGILHLNLTPRRVILAPPGASILEFGILRAVIDALPANASQTGVALGSLAYMSPEQAAAEPLDARSDIYSLGCILYTALVGEPPHAAQTQRATLMRRLVEPAPSARARRDTVPAELDHVVARALARVPADRFSSALALRDALAALVAGPGAV